MFAGIDDLTTGINTAEQVNGLYGIIALNTCLGGTGTHEPVTIVMRTITGQ